MYEEKPKFMENIVVAPSYSEQPAPYANVPSCHVNLLELSRYAKQCGKKMWLYNAAQDFGVMGMNA